MEKTYQGPMTEHHFNFRGHRICFYSGGSGAPLIFLHNGGNDHRIWDYQINRFVAEYRVYALDLLGYGNSETPDIEYTLEYYTDMLEAFIAEEHISSPVLAGNCVGSAISLSLAMRKPSLVRGLVLFNILSPSTLSPGAFGLLYRMTRKSSFFRRIVRSLARRLTAPGLVRGISLKMQYGKGTRRDEEFGKHARTLYAQKGQLRALYSLVCNMHTFEILETVDFRRGLPPAVIIWGGKNRVLPISHGSDMYGSAGPMGFTVFEKGGHLVMREYFEEVNHCIHGFLEGLTSSVPPTRG